MSIPISSSLIFNISLWVTIESLENLSEFNFADSDDLISIPKNGKVTLQVKTLEVLNNLDLKFRILNALTSPKENPVVNFRIST